MSQPNGNRAIVIYQIEDDQYSYGGEKQAKISIKVRDIDPGTDPGEPVFTRHYGPEENLENLSIIAYLSTGSGCYGWRASFQQPYSVELPDAKYMARTLRATEKYLQRCGQTEGRPESFGHYVNQVARAFGASYALAYSRDMWTNGLHYRRMSLGDAVHYVNHALDKWQEQHNGQKIA